MAYLSSEFLYERENDNWGWGRSRACMVSYAYYGHNTLHMKKEKLKTKVAGWGERWCWVHFTCHESRSVVVPVLSCHRLMWQVVKLKDTLHLLSSPLCLRQTHSRSVFMISPYLSRQSCFPLKYFWCSIFNEITLLLQNLSSCFSSDISLECVSAPSAKPQWIQAMKDTALAIEERLYWECRANGKPKPSYTWLKNGQQLLSGVNYSLSPATYQYFIWKT